MKRRRLFALVLIALLAVLAVMPTLAQDNHVFIQGAPLAGSSNGLAIDAEGHLIIANVFVGTITVMDPVTGEILQEIEPTDDWSIPDDVTIGPDGAIYWTEPIKGEVWRIFPDGERSKIAEGLPGANPLRFADDGRFFVGQCFCEDCGVYEVDPQGVEAPRLVVGGLTGCAVNAFDFGPDGLLYAPRFYNQELVRINVDTGEMATLVDGLDVPVAVEFDSQFRLHYADQNGELNRVDLETGAIEKFVKLDIGLDNLVFDAEDRLYVSSAVDGSITEVLPDGSIRVVSPGGMTAPLGVAVKSSKLYVTEPYAVRTFDRNTGELLSVVRSYGTQSTIGQPFTVIPDGDNLMLASGWDNAVRIWNPATNHTLEMYTDFEGSANALRFQGDLVVAEWMSGNVVRTSGEESDQHETLITLTAPIGLAATEDELWVSDWQAGEIWQLASHGEMLPDARLVVDGLNAPEMMAVTPDGQLVVIETGTGNLLSLDPVTGQWRIIAGGLAFASPAVYDNGVAVADDGTIYVSGHKGNVIYRFEPGS